MPSFPPPGAVTICEINRDLVAADALSDDRAKEAYGGVLGMVFSPIPFQPDALAPNQEPRASDEPETTEIVPETSLASTIIKSFKQMIFPSSDPSLLEEFDTQKVSWNPHKHCLAFVSGKNQVTVHDFEEPDNKESCILTSDHQKDIKAVEWRPNSGKMIAVGCKGGICLWSASYPGNVASVKSGVTSSPFGAFSRGSGGQWILVDILYGSSAELVSTLSWKPDGRYLASASCNSPSFTIWDVSQGLGTPIRRGLSSISLIRWSPSGDYLLTSKFDGTFHLWETNTWTSEPWSSSNGYVSGANWDPEGRTALLSFSNSTTLGSIHFSSKPPSLGMHSFTHMATSFLCKNMLLHLLSDS
ncbi:hypothetical protein GUJ93_ZPchr0007g3967 [Zizania palustris]|uniref:Anaphase-promoting complex subunit 4-like WD40 domain-containing protein n=1 Tax=Zizania palustris TaxID=103762 RepID=A0A8J5THG1_ZIZPA|nr:hypothetical protein GUJ93_ZPchr0007g3967 [Zizania palustris]